MPAVKGLYSVLLYTQDLAASLRFYRDQLGLQPMGPENDGVVLLGAGNAVMVLHRADGDPDWPVPGIDRTPGGHSITFAVDDPDNWAQRLSQAGVRIVRGPLDQVWGRVLFVLDPDGRVIVLARPTF